MTSYMTSQYLIIHCRSKKLTVSLYLKPHLVGGGAINRDYSHRISRALTKLLMRERRQLTVLQLASEVVALPASCVVRSSMLGGVAIG